jgi:hypothetical protein
VGCGGQAEALTSELKKPHFPFFLSLKRKPKTHLSLTHTPQKKKIQQFMVLFILRQGVDGLSEVSDCAVQPD